MRLSAADQVRPEQQHDCWQPCLALALSLGFLVAVPRAGGGCNLPVHDLHVDTDPDRPV